MSWVRGRNQEFAKLSHRNVSLVRIQHSPPKFMIIKVKCKACKETGKMKTYEGREIDCVYCKGTTFRDKVVPHPSHKMSEWRTEIRCPGSEPRFYGVRDCENCGEEELEHAAGHFLEGLLAECKG